MGLNFSSLFAFRSITFAFEHNRNAFVEVLLSEITPIPRKLLRLWVQNSKTYLVCRYHNINLHTARTRADGFRRRNGQKEEKRGDVEQIQSHRENESLLQNSERGENSGGQAERALV